MDRNIIAAHHYYADQEDAAARECYAAAAADLHAANQADECDNGSLNCTACPFFKNRIAQ